MKGTIAFCPDTGADLGTDRHRPGELHEAPQKEPQDGTGRLALGGRRSSKQALARYWGRAYRKSHHGQSPPDGVKRAQAIGIYALKSRTESNPPDDRLWLALTEFLARKGFWSTWMHSHVDVTCPRCGSLCRWEPRITGVDVVRCGASCGKDGSSDRSFEIVDRVLELYNAAFATGENDEGIGELVTV